MNDQLKYYKDSISGTYSQLFFSNNSLLGLCILVATFINPYAGLSGLLCALISIAFSKLFGFNPTHVRSGGYSYNSLLVGLGMGSSYKFSPAFFCVLLIACIFTLFISVKFSAVETKKKIPFLSLPFVIGIWAVFLALRSFTAIQLEEREVFDFAKFWNLEQSFFNLFCENNIVSNQWYYLFEAYFKSLGAIFFQYNIIAGIIIASGLLFYSRIAFSLSVIGCFIGYAFWHSVQGNISLPEFSYIGFNYILTAIALGGFFMVPSRHSYLLAILSVVLVGLITSALNKFFGIYHLPLYSLPFVLCVTLVVAVLKERYFIKGLNAVQFQQFQPEKNLYAHTNNAVRFKNDTYFHIHLPFFGEWNISQGHDGKITHKEDWRHAWDFVVTDDTQKTFRLPANSVENFFCYNLPVLAPCAGYVVDLVDGIDDNSIGEVNMNSNWGNTIIIKHGDYLFSKISHIRKGSFQVKKDDYVKKGEVLAHCGNSGRSPEPHIHFQLQANAYIGSKTLKYPIAYYVSKENNEHKFHSFEYPNEGQNIFRATPTALINQAFGFVPGMIFNFEIGDEKENKKEIIKWEVFTDANNNSYIYCYQTKSVAYFVNNETLLYFTDFRGDYKSLLYYFYLGAHKVLLSYFQNMKLTDTLPIAGFYKGISKWMQDFISPFKIYFNANYQMEFVETDDEKNPQKIKLISHAISKTGNREKRKINFEFELENNRINKFIIKENSKCIIATSLE